MLKGISKDIEDAAPFVKECPPFTGGSMLTYTYECLIPLESLENKIIYQVKCSK